MLPLLHAEVVDPGWVSDEQFVAGYGAAQAVPGPLFTFAAYLGAVAGPEPNGDPGRGAGARRDLPAVVPAARGHAAVLDALRAHPRLVRPLLRGQRGGRRPAARRALRPGLDERDRSTAATSRSRVALFVLLTVARLPAWAVVAVAAGAGAVFLS